jgi:tetratricopeptide (TPR) repeat protein
VSDLTAFLEDRDRPIPADGHSRDGRRPDGQAGPTDLSALVDLVRELQAKAEACAYWQGRALVLEAELAAAREQLRALPAPDGPVDAPERPTANGTAQPARALRAAETALVAAWMAAGLVLQFPFPASPSGEVRSDSRWSDLRPCRPILRTVPWLTKGNCNTTAQGGAIAAGARRAGRAELARDRGSRARCPPPPISRDSAPIGASARLERGRPRRSGDQRRNGQVGGSSDSARDHWTEATSRLNRLLDGLRLDDAGSPELDLLWMAGSIAWMRGDLTLASQWIEHCLTAGRQRNQQRVLARALGIAAQLAAARGDYATARRLSEEGLPLARDTGERWSEARYLDGLALLAIEQGEFDDTAKWLRSSLEVARAMGDAWSEAAALNKLGDVARGQRDYARRALV